jgi:hypothetical protein
VAVEADALTPEHLAAAAARTVVRRPVDRGAPMRRSGRFRRRRVQSLR